MRYVNIMIILALGMVLGIVTAYTSINVRNNMKIDKSRFIDSLKAVAIHECYSCGGYPVVTSWDGNKLKCNR